VVASPGGGGDVEDGLFVDEVDMGRVEAGVKLDHGGGVRVWVWEWERGAITGKEAWVGRRDG
jgi:hypothetical protein